MKKKIVTMILSLSILFAFTGCMSNSHVLKATNDQLGTVSNMLSFQCLMTDFQNRFIELEYGALLLQHYQDFNKGNYTTQAENSSSFAEKTVTRLGDYKTDYLSQMKSGVKALNFPIPDTEIDTMISKFNSSATAFHQYFLKAKEDGINTDFNSIKPLLNTGTEDIKTAQQTFNTIQSHLDGYIQNYKIPAEGIQKILLEKKLQPTIEVCKAGYSLIKDYMKFYDLKSEFLNLYYGVPNTFYMSYNSSKILQAPLELEQEALANAAKILEQIKQNKEQISLNSPLVISDPKQYERLIEKGEKTLEVFKKLVEAQTEYTKASDWSKLSDNLEQMDSVYEDFIIDNVSILETVRDIVQYMDDTIKGN